MEDRVSQARACLVSPGPFTGRHTALYHVPTTVTSSYTSALALTFDMLLQSHVFDNAIFGSVGVPLLTAARDGDTIASECMEFYLKAPCKNAESRIALVLHRLTIKLSEPVCGLVMRLAFGFCKL
jgi:hypothetical protein